jgi:hypothetical protein
MSGEQNTPNVVEKAVSRMTGGSTRATTAAVSTSSSAASTAALRTATSRSGGMRAPRGSRRSLNGPEFYAVSPGYLRNWSCLGQCSLHLQVLQHQMLRRSMLTYRNDVCAPNLTELKRIIDDGG